MTELVTTPCLKLIIIIVIAIAVVIIIIIIIVVIIVIAIAIIISIIMIAMQTITSQQTVSTVCFHHTTAIAAAMPIISLSTQNPSNYQTYDVLSKMF
jgi:hypothetical protein